MSATATPTATPSSDGRTARSACHPARPKSLPTQWRGSRPGHSPGSAAVSSVFDERPDCSRDEQARPRVPQLLRLLVLVPPFAR